MLSLLHKDCRTFEIVPWGEGRPDATLLELLDEDAALRFFRGLLGDHHLRASLRALAARGALGELSDREVVERLAAQVVAGQLQVVEHRPVNWEGGGVGGGATDAASLVDYVPKPKPKPVVAAAPVGDAVGEEPEWEVDEFVEDEDAEGED